MNCIDKYISDFNSEESLKKDLNERVKKNLLTLNEDDPKISIVIPSYNQGKYLEKTILSILLQNYPNYEIILIDGGSADESSNIIKKYEEYLKYWISEKDEGQADAINKGLKFAAGQIFNWLNSDDYLEEGAFRKISEVYKKNRNAAGWVGACRRYDENGGTINIIYPNNLERENIGQNWNGRQFYQPSCFLNTQFVKELNGVDKTFNAPFDLDLWLRILEKGELKIGKGIWANALIHGAAKTQKARNSMFEETITVQKKYGFNDGANNRHERVFSNGKLEFVMPKYLKNNLSHSNNKTITAFGKSFQNKKLIIVSNYMPRFDKTSSNKRLYELLKIFVSLEFNITFIYRNKSEDDERYKNIFNGSVHFYYFPFEHEEMSSLITSLMPDYVWITNLWTVKNIIRAAHLTIELKAKTSAKIIADTMDFHFKKYMRKYELSNEQLDLETALEFLNYEKVLYKDSDLVVTVTDEDKKDIISKAAVKANVDVIPNIHEEYSNGIKFGERNHICFLGNYKVNHNYDAVKNFAENIFPEILKYNPSTEFHLIGNDVEHYCKEFESKNVKLIGFVENLEETLSKYKLVVCPMNYGAGMKGKIGEAAASGLPIVSTSIGIEGINFTDGEECFVADSHGDFAGKCLHLLSDPICWNNFSVKAKIKMGTNFGIAAVTKKIINLFENLDLDITGKSAELKEEKNVINENRIVRAGAKNLFDNDLLKINWVITRKCNYTCSYCNVYDNENGYFQPIEKLAAAADQIKKLGKKNIHITLTGGEPTIHPKYAGFIKYLSDNLDGKVLISTITNLSRTERFFTELCEKLKPHKDKINFRASYHFEFANTEDFIKNAKIISESGILIYISLLAHPEHMNEVRRLESRLKEIRNEKLKYEIIVVRENYGTVPDKRYSEKELEWLNKFYSSEEVHKELIIDTENLGSKEIKREFYSAPELNSKGLNNYKGMICNAGKNMFSINEHGDVDKAVCFRKAKANKKNIYSGEDISGDLSNPVVCPFEKCGCIADLQIPKYLQGYGSLKENETEKENVFSKILKEKLKGKNWLHKFEFYNKDFVSINEFKKAENPNISIIVISWRLHPDTLKNFQLLDKQRKNNFELIFINNGGKDGEFESVIPFINTYVKLSRNTGAYVARNIGSVFAKSKILFFLEDDGLPVENLIEEHLRIHNTYNIAALRGVYLPKTDNPLNKAQYHYNLGGVPIPYYLNLEGNLSIKSHDFFEVDGFSDEIIYGYGGADLAYRLKSANPEKEPSWYFPEPKIYHDYTYDTKALFNKMQVQNKSLENLAAKYPAFNEFMEYYRVNHQYLNATLNENDQTHFKSIMDLLNSYKINKDKLLEKLESINWQSKYNLYKKYFESVEYLNVNSYPSISIIVISWRLHKDTIKNFEALQNQRVKNFELIFINNGGDGNEFEPIKNYVDTYITLNENTGAYLARNIGAAFSNSDIIFFLEDDGIADSNLIEAHLNAHKNFDIIAARGVYTPKTNNPLNQMQSHYYLGNKPFAVYADLEGNTTYKAETFFKVGGWDDDIKFGSGGVELSIRLTEIEPGKRKQIYIPDAVIFHDFAKDEEHLKHKFEKQEQSRARLRIKHPNWDEFIKSWEVYSGKDSSVIKKENKTKVNLKLTPLISICVPTYNQAHLIKDGLQSAINQTYQNIEIIVVDDGSEDNTKEIVNSFQSSKIKYVFKEHTNAADTRNKAIKEAKGEFIFWLDSDDVLDLRIIEEYIAVYNNYPDADIFYSNLYCIDLTGKLLHLFEYEDYYNNNQKMIQFLFKGQPIPNPGTMINKKVFDVTGLFNTEFKRAHDYEFFTRLVLLNKFKTKHINKLMYTYRIHENNITLNTSGKINFEFERKIFNTLISQNDLKIFFPDIDWNTNPAAAQTVVNLKIGLRFYELEGYEEATIYLKKFFEVDRDEKNFIDLINKFANDGNFIQAKNLIDNLNGVSKFFPNYTQIKSIIDEAVFHAQIEEN